MRHDDQVAVQDHGAPGGAEGDPTGRTGHHLEPGHRDHPDHLDDADHTAPPSDLALRVRALESLLVEKGLVDPDAVDELIDTYEHRVGPRNGAAVVARAWTEPTFRTALLTDGSSAVATMGFGGIQGEVLRVVENQPDVWNLVVCTLCSCYPWPLLGLPPAWYKAPAYRARAVSEPRQVLAEMGTVVDADVEIRVWDSTSEVRYLVLPMRPEGTAGWSADDLARLVTRNSMIGVEPASAAAGAGTAR
jgi:nitrile hydratase